jgi:hypothetical protein
VWSSFLIISGSFGKELHFDFKKALVACFNVLTFGMVRVAAGNILIPLFSTPFVPGTALSI